MLHASRERKEVMIMLLGRVARVCAVLVCVILALVGASPAGRADEVAIVGQVTAGTYAVTVSPQTIDLSCMAGESASARVVVANEGTIPATVTVASVTFAGLDPVDPALFSPTDETQGDKCVLKLDFDYGGEAYLVGGQLTEPLSAGLSGAGGTVREVALYVELATNRWCPGATLGGKIVLDIQPAP